MSSQKFIIETYCILLKKIPGDEKEHKECFQNIGDSIVHTAPEVIHTAWKRIFNYCSENFNDDTCDWHKEMREIYNSRYDDWIRLASK